MQVQGYCSCAWEVQDQASSRLGSYKDVFLIASIALARTIGLHACPP